jgi:phosphoribosylformylglycinamidine synthase
MQILTEAGLLPGALLRNESLEFRCGWVYLRIHAPDPHFLGHASAGSVLSMPVSHGEGRYHCTPEELTMLLAGDQVLLRYCDAEGAYSDGANPNGSLGNIAGIRNAEGNVFGLMPHPERACESLLGSDDGLLIFRAMIEAMHG